jgi:hypothetical protein
MLRLVGSSNPGDVERDTAVRLLTERAILTRAVCRELLDDAPGFDGRRPCVALDLLLQWVQQHLQESVHIEPHASDGLDKMIVPDKCRDLLQEIRKGAEVCEALFMLWTADTPREAEGDRARIRDALQAYWGEHPSAAAAPSVMDCWSGASSDVAKQE